MQHSPENDDTWTRLAFSRWRILQQTVVVWGLWGGALAVLTQVLLFRWEMELGGTWFWFFALTPACAAFLGWATLPTVHLRTNYQLGAALWGLAWAGLWWAAFDTKNVWAHLMYAGLAGGVALFLAWLATSTIQHALARGLFLWLPESPLDKAFWWPQRAKAQSNETTEASTSLPASSAFDWARAALNLPPDATLEELPAAYQRAKTSLAENRGTLSPQDYANQAMGLAQAYEALLAGEAVPITEPEAPGQDGVSLWRSGSEPASRQTAIEILIREQPAAIRELIQEDPEAVFLGIEAAAPGWLSLFFPHTLPPAFKPAWVKKLEAGTAPSILAYLDAAQLRGQTRFGAALGALSAWPLAALFTLEEARAHAVLPGIWALGFTLALVILILLPLLGSTRPAALRCWLLTVPAMLAGMFGGGLVGVLTQMPKTGLALGTIGGFAILYGPVRARWGRIVLCLYCGSRNPALELEQVGCNACQKNARVP